MLIVQCFNQSFASVSRSLPRLARLGFSHVLISPPQKSHSSRSWWGRYQPVDFTRIEGPLGSEDQLRSLCQRAAERGLAVVADTVIHHLSNESRYLKVRAERVVEARYPRFGPADFQGLYRPGRGRGLPVLNPRVPWVRQQLAEFLGYLFELGVRGFRFDSARHLDPSLLGWLLRQLPPVLSFGEFVCAHPEEIPSVFLEHMLAYDFPLAHHLKRAFAPGGDLGSLVQPVSLWGPRSVPFVNHHDLVRNRAAFDFFRVGDPRDRELAHLYLLLRPHGIPLVYAPDLRSKLIQAGLEFRRATEQRPMEWLAASRQHLAWRRGSALVAINKSAQDWWWPAPLRAGAYHDVVQGQPVFSAGGTVQLRVPARGCRLLLD